MKNPEPPKVDRYKRVKEWLAEPRKGAESELSPPIVQHDTEEVTKPE